ncbi:MAG: hypothetical protein NTY47_05395 [Candidatus Omnitrophica bacterium]|nr:hypothetical protein [Candidatus Omnitrophota bacterium]
MGNKGMVTLETVVLMIVVALGLLAMQTYLRRSIQAHWRTNADTFYDEQYSSSGSSNEVFKNPVNNQPAITLTPNPSPSLAGSYDPNTHIGAFNIPAGGGQNARSTSVLIGSSAAQPATILTVGQWQAPCVGEACGNNDGEDE